MNSFGADFLLRFRPFQSSFLPFNPPYISNKGFNSDVVPTRWNAGDTETLCRFLDSYAEKDNGKNGRKGNVKTEWRMEGEEAMVPNVGQSEKLLP